MRCIICDKVLMNKHNMKLHELSCIKISKIKDEIIRLYVDEFNSISDISKMYNIGKTKVIEIIGDNKRSRSEGGKIRIKRYGIKNHSNETKKIMSEKRLKWIKENPEKTAWRKTSMSYPEKLFLNKIIELGWDKKYLIENEKSVYPYFIDFAFNNEKIAIEIDGSQHLLPDRIESDKKKDELLLENGWKVIRITAKEIISNLDNFINELEKLLISDVKYLKVGILKESKKREKVDRSINRFTKLEKEKQLSERKIDRPSYEQLIEDLKNNTYVKVGKKYNVSDNCIRKWIKMYEKYGLDF